MDWFLAVLTSVLSLVVGQFLGYLLAIRKTKMNIAAEKRAEYVSRFVSEAWNNLEYFADPKKAKEDTKEGKTAGEVKKDFTMLGHQAGFFVRKDARKEIKILTDEFANGIRKLNDPDDLDSSEIYNKYKDQLEKVEDLLRNEISADNSSLLESIRKRVCSIS